MTSYGTAANWTSAYMEGEGLSQDVSVEEHIMPHDVISVHNSNKYYSEGIILI